MSNGASQNPNGIVIDAQSSRSALQAIYHAVTGKTENYSKAIDGNVVVKKDDIENLYERLRQQIEHYDLLADPTVTVVVKNENNKTVTYSSWERFNALRVNNHDLTSQFLLKIEMVIRLPKTETDQRFIISISIDSGLPVLHSNDYQQIDVFADVFAFFARNFRTVEISIDFVDFLIAKIFSASVEERFETLEKAPKPRFTGFLQRNIRTINSLLHQSGRIGAALYIAAFAYLSRDKLVDPQYVAYSISIVIVIFSAVSLINMYVSRSISRRITRNMIPSVIIISNGDVLAYDAARAKLNSSTLTMLRIGITIIFSIGINVISSYIYSILLKN